MLSPRLVFDNPAEYREFFSTDSDDQFEDQHFERKEVRQEGSSTKRAKHLDAVRKGIVKTVSAFANSNVEGGLLVIGISSDGTIKGIDHLLEDEKNSLTNFSNSH